MKHLLIAVLLVLGAVGVAGAMHSTITGEFFLHEVPVTQELIADEDGLSVLGMKEDQKELTNNLERIQLRRWSGGFLTIYGDRTQHQNILEQLTSLTKGAAITLTHLEKKGSWDSVWLTALSQVIPKETTRSTLKKS